MKYYHGSTTKGLTQLHPHISIGAKFQEPRVYLTSNRQLALHYIWDTQRLGLKMPMLDIRNDGTLVFQEMFSGALKYFYKGISGYIYQCEGDYPADPNVPTSVSTNEIVPVIDCEYIDDVYEHILRYEAQGKFIYEHYEDLPQWRIDVIRGQIIRFIKRNDLIADNIHPSRKFIMEKFPQYWAEAQVLYDHNLL